MMALLFALLLFLGAAQFANAQDGNWTSVTNQRSVSDIESTADVLICATNGGVVVFDPLQQQFVGSFTNINGLSSNQPAEVIVDHDGNWWLGMEQGALNSYRADNQSWEVFRDFERLTIHDMELRGDSLFVALDIGVSVFLLGKKEAKETYKKLGNIPVEVDAWDTLVDWPLIYVATDHGLSVADLRQVNLKAPQSWQNFTGLNGLVSNKVLALGTHAGNIFVGTDRGVQKFTDGQFESVYASFPPQAVVAFASRGNDFYAAVNKFVYKYDPNLDRWNREVTLSELITALLIDDTGALWLGTEESGLIKWSPDQEAEVFLPNGPAGNSFADLLFAADEKLWCASAPLGGHGVYNFNGTTWSNFSMGNGDIPGDATVALVEDLNGNVWVGSWGEGVFRFSPQGQIDVFDETDDKLAGITANLSFVVVNSMALDQAGTIWMTNFRAFNGNQLVAVTADGQWLYFGAEDGVFSSNPQAIAVDQFNRKWVGTDGGGIYVYDDNRTPADKSDDVVGSLTGTDGLSSNIIKDLAIDEFDIVWIVTNEGLEFYQSGEIRRQFGLITNEVNTIEIDPVGNKWVGSSAGVSILDRDEFRWTHHTTDNSPLVSSNVLSVAFDKKTGDAFVGTSNGLSIFQTPFVEPSEKLEELSLFPNPLMIGASNSTASLIIDGLCRNCDVNIYTSSGFLVRKLVSGSKGGRATWDGRDSDGELVPSGIYLAVAAQPDGVAKTGKVAVINE
jgi:ligand-binding sensor domain-containing protein